MTLNISVLKKLIMRLSPLNCLVHLRGLTLQTAVTHHAIQAYGLKQALSLRQDRNYQFITFLICNIGFRNVSSTRREPTPVSSVTLPAVHSPHPLSYPVSFFMSSQNIKLVKIHIIINLATLEEGSCNDNMTCTGGCRYSLVYSWWWVWKAPETCRVTLQGNKIDCEQLHLVGLL